MKIVDSILILSIMIFVSFVFLYANDEGIKEMHDIMAVIVEKEPAPLTQEVVEKYNIQPSYILQPVKSI